METYEYRQALIDTIEGVVGVYEAVWNEWPTKDLETLCRYVRRQEAHRLARETGDVVTGQI